MIETILDLYLFIFIILLIFMRLLSIFIINNIKADLVMVSIHMITQIPAFCKLIFEI